MTFELKMTKEQVVAKLRDLYGTEFTTPDDKLPSLQRKNCKLVIGGEI